MKEIKSTEKCYIGAKFFRYTDEGKLEVIRIIRSKPDVFIVVRNNDPDLVSYKSANDLQEYTLLRYNALYTFNIVVNAKDDVEVKDVIVTMMRKDDKEPYVVCRQMMKNIFAEMIDPDEVVLGNCVSQESCPPDIRFGANLLCDHLVKTISVYGYINDNPEDILGLASKVIIGANKFLSKQQKALQKHYKGLCSSTEQLLKDNGFWDEVNKGLKIFELKDKIEDCKLTLEQQIYLEKEISYLMDNITVLEYDHDIDFSKIQTSYMILKDSDKKFYLVNYIRGSFLQQEHLSDEEIAKFTSIKI